MKITLTGEESLRLEKLGWPSLPAEPWPRVIRAANLDGVHKTLTHPIDLSVDAVGVESPEIKAPAPLTP